MSFKSIVRWLRDMKDRTQNISETKHWSDKTTTSHIVRWLMDMKDWILNISERKHWSNRTTASHFVTDVDNIEITKQIVKTHEECDTLTSPISPKQPAPHESPIQCFIKRDRANSVYRLYFGMTPSEGAKDKLLLAAKRIRRATSIEFVISLVADDFSQASSTYAGQLRSNFLGTKFTIYDGQPPNDRGFHANQVSAGVPACNYIAATVSYEVISLWRPRKIHCPMYSIPLSSILEGGSSPTPKSSSPPLSKAKELAIDISSSGFSRSTLSEEPLVLKDKAPLWDEKLRKWYLSAKCCPDAPVIVPSQKNFQLVAALDNIPVAEQEKVILQCAKIGDDIFGMDYHYPLSAFQAFAICLTMLGSTRVL